MATVTILPTGHIQGDWAIVRHQHGPLPILLPPHHSTYTEPMATMVTEIQLADTTYLPTYITSVVGAAMTYAWFAYV